ncbi:hypothetical protein Ndes2437B_g05510 [Nannochloris sp. 'desiccata']
MAFVRALVFSSLLACILVSSSRAATECDNRKAACEATCQDQNAISDFKCDERNGAISSSCACAMPGSSSSSSSSSSGSDSSSSNPITPPEEISIPAAATCEEKAKSCEASCPEGTSAQFDCQEDQTKAASASADSCVCSPTDSPSSTPTPTNPFTAPTPIQGTIIAPVTPDVTDATTGLPATSTTTERSATTVVNSAYTNRIWKVVAGSLFGAALAVVW